AQLGRAQRAERKEQRAAIATKVSEIFPELAEKAAATLAQLGVDGLDHATAAVNSAAEANRLLAASEASARAALEARDYDGLEQHAGGARQYQATLSAQR